MPSYSYIAKNTKGQPKTGSLEAKDKHELAKILREEGYILITASSKKEVEPKKTVFSIPFLNQVSLVDKIFFCRNLKVMVTAGVSLPRSLKILSQQTKNQKFKKAILDISEEIIKGQNFSESLKKYPIIFPELFSSMVKVGEESGTLEQALTILTQQMEKEHELKSKIMGAMIYPSVIIIAMIGVGILMLVLVIPSLAETFNELGVELPLTTRIIIAIGNFTAKFWYLMPLIIIALIVFSRMIVKTKNGKRVFDFLVLRIPVVGKIIIKTNSAYTVRTLSSLIESGLPIVRALEVVSGVLGNIYFKEVMQEAAREVKEGAKLAEILKKYKNVYPSLVIQMIEIGEETGETSTILEKLADFYEEEVFNATKNLSVIIEPVLMLIIGAVIGFFAISMIQPIYSMMGTLQ